MGIEQQGPARAVMSPHQQVGDALQAGGAHLGIGNRKFFGSQSQSLQQACGQVGVRCIVARGGIAGHAHQGLQESHLLVKVGVDPGVELFVGNHQMGSGWYGRAVGQHASDRLQLGG